MAQGKHISRESEEHSEKLCVPSKNLKLLLKYLGEIHQIEQLRENQYNSMILPMI